MPCTMFIRLPAGTPLNEIQDAQAQLSQWFGTAIIDQTLDLITLDMSAHKATKHINSTAWTIPILTFHFSDDNLIACPALPIPSASWFTEPGITSLPFTSVPV